MFRTIIILGVTGIALSACTPKQMTYGEAIAYCQDKSADAAGVRGNATVGVGTGGTRAGLSLSISESFIRGDDPKVVYDTCMTNLSNNGQISGASE